MPYQGSPWGTALCTWASKQMSMCSQELQLSKFSSNTTSEINTISCLLSLSTPAVKMPAWIGCLAVSVTLFVCFLKEWLELWTSVDTIVHGRPTACIDPKAKKSRSSLGYKKGWIKDGVDLHVDTTALFLVTYTNKLLGVCGWTGHIH